MKRLWNFGIKNLTATTLVGGSMPYIHARESAS